MADVSVKMGVSGISQFRSEINQAQASVKTYDSALKLAEKQFRATGNAEQFLQDKTNALQGKLTAQQSAVRSLEAALKSMKDSGVDQASTAYQKMERNLLQAQAAVLDTQNDINNLGAESADAAGKTEKLADSLGGLNKKVSLEQVISGINSITSGMERASGKAIEMGKAIWDNVMNSARWADDSATMALMYGIDLDTFLRVQKLVQNGMDTSVEAILMSQSRMRKNVGSGSDSIMEVLRELNLLQTNQGKYENQEIVPADDVALFWEAGQAIMSLTDAFEKEDKAQKLFGRGWKELVPLFTDYKNQEEFNKALAETSVNTEDEVSKLVELNDAVGKLEGQFDTLETKFLSEIAPGLTKGAEALGGLLENVLDYLETPEGRQALEDMGTAVEGLFKDLGEIDPQKVVEGFTGVFNGIVDGLKWLEENSGTVVGAMEAIVAGWAGLKLTGGILEIVKLINGISGLAGGGAAAAAGQAGAAAGASWGGAFAKAVIAAAPWLAGIYTLLNPAEGGNDDLIDSNGELTNTAKDLGYTLDSKGQIATNRKPGRSDLTLEEIVSNASEGTKKQPLTIDLTYDSKPVSTMGPAGQTMALLDILTGGKQQVEVPVDPEAPEDAAERIADQVGTVLIGARIVPISLGGGPGGSGRGVVAQFHANGLPFVPFDGYPAILHKGERVMTANENRSYTYNTYFGNVNLNNGLEVEQLAESIEKRNKRQRNGYGS